MTETLIRPRIVRRWTANLRPNDVVHFPGGSYATVNEVGPEYTVKTRSYHLVTLTGPDGATRQSAFARVAFWDVEVH